jgi:hypothetical protein
MDKQNFDCVEFHRQTREKFFQEADCNIEKLIEIQNETIKNNELLIFLENRQKKNKVA